MGKVMIRYECIVKIRISYRSFKNNYKNPALRMNNHQSTSIPMH